MDEENQQNCYQKKSWSAKLPCARFVIAAGISIAAFSIGSTMLILSPVNDPLVPFWSSLITGTISVWVDAPNYDGKK